MFMMATDNNTDLKIVDDHNYKYTEEDLANNTRIIVNSKEI